MKIAIVIGNRPHFIKCAPLLKELEKHSDIEPIIIHSGQHYDTQLSGVFLKDFNFPPVDVNLNVGSAPSSIQTGTILSKLDPVLREFQPDCLVSMGDTNTTLAASLAAFYRHIPNAHIEAGMRENIWRPEEINKKIADHCGDYLFAPIPRAVENLKKEGIDPARIFLTGDITLDTFTANRERANKWFSELQPKLNIPDKYDLVTLHRAETVDDPDTLHEILAAFADWPCSLVFPVHPRTDNKINSFGLSGFWDENPHIYKLPALSYMDFLSLLLNAQIVATDSSGVLKEAFYAQKLCLVLDDTSEYHEIFEAEAALMGGRQLNSIQIFRKKIDSMIFPDRSSTIFGTGNAAKVMVQTLIDVPPYFTSKF